MEEKKFAVIGNPIAHSKSPSIHAAFAKQFGIKLHYEPVLATLETLETTIASLQQNAFSGANITVPFKFKAHQLCHRISSSAQQAKAVNTLSFSNQETHGDNTDGIGLKRDIEINFKYALAGKNLLILGAGGAAHGVLHALSVAASVTIANRTMSKTIEMLTNFKQLNAQAVEYQALNTPFDIVINATSTGLSDTVLPISRAIFGKHTLAYDMMYGRITPFMALANSAGAQVADGLGMLVEQAAEAFYIWHEKKPETASVLAMLRTALAK